MKDGAKKTCVYTISLGLSFIDVLAKGILEEAGQDPLALARIQILLPTRRACRSLREAFLRLSDKPLLLPRMNPIGDVDEEELSLTLASIEEELDMLPAISPLHRQFLLMRLIARQGQGRSLEQDMMLATALGRLMDQIYTENLDLADLPKAIDREDFAKHWDISLRFLELLSVHWPLILAENGMIDAADRRNRLLKKLSAHWRKNPPAHKIIAAGSTGSIPATAELLKTIANLPDGCIVLPGLDQIMDEASWKAMDDTHAQDTLRHLLETLDINRGDAALWPSSGAEKSTQKTMRVFTSELMRPADTTEEWQTAGKRLALNEKEITLERYDCANPQEEALTIALALRDVLEDSKKTAALVTPDRRLARRVAMACRRWGIEIDDSGGQPLSETRVGTYLRLCIEALCGEMKPVVLLALCKHTLCLPPSRKDWRGEIRDLDHYVFRGPSFDGGMRAHDKKINRIEEENKKRGSGKQIDTTPFKKTLAFIEKSFAPLLDFSGNRTFPEWCEAHLRVAENFCSPDFLWAGQDGEAASLLFSYLREQQDLLPPMTGYDYLAILEQAMRGIAVRPAFGLHPRLTILGQLEARLVEADVMILAGLNEGTWPPAPQPDPWMSRPMRKRFGLPSPERSIGLSAHDFAQALCADKVILTRSLRVDGTPTVPARWLQRMDTVLQACGLSPDILKRGKILAQARLLDHADSYAPVERPRPRPPVDARPRKLSVTQIDTWMKDPYSIYAKHILKLDALKPLEQSLDAAMRGTLIHDVLDQFVEAYPDDVPDDAAKNFLTIARDELDALGLEEDVKIFWEPRLVKIANWLVASEQSWRKTMKPMSREARGEISFDGSAGSFILSARADRIDESRDGTQAAIIDYKSGGSYTVKGMQNGQFPQLPLEALIVEAGKFDKTKALPVSALSYWVVNGGKDGGTIITVDNPDAVDHAKENAWMGINNLIAHFDQADTPYFSLPCPENAPRYNDYEHLARVREWAALDESEDAA
jgi:ATP-dependent helicase/nuclease subunit B